MLFIKQRSSRAVMYVVVAVYLNLIGNNVFATNTGQIGTAPPEIKQFIQWVVPNHPRNIAAQA
jgi:hypothetical protein